MSIDDSQWISLDVRWLNATDEFSGRFNINFSPFFKACNSNRQHHTARGQLQLQAVASHSNCKWIRNPSEVQLPTPGPPIAVIGTPLNDLSMQRMSANLRLLIWTNGGSIRIARIGWNRIWKTRLRITRSRRDVSSAYWSYAYRDRQSWFWPQNSVLEYC